MGTLLLIWPLVTGILFVWRARRSDPGVGLLFAYVGSLWLTHWVAAATYVSGNYRARLNDDALVFLGLRESTYSLVGFAVGSLLLTPLVSGFRRHRAATRARFQPSPQLPSLYLLIGALAYVSIAVVSVRIPTAGALLAVGQQLLVVGVCLLLWRAWHDRRGPLVAFLLGLTLLLPFVTILVQGFIGYGAAAAVVIVAFTAKFFRPRWLLILLATVVFYAAMSLLVSYLRDRGDIRAVVWGGGAFSQRSTVVLSTLRNFEWLDISNEEHLVRVDQRLNQDALVGAAVRNLSVSGDYARGETLFRSVIGLIPRAIWPSKPDTAGSGQLVSQYTGIAFAPGTSIGIGQVMELYVNFGSAGVALGAALIGLAVTSIDQIAGRRLARRDWQRFALWHLVGISFMQIGGSFFELTTSAGASVVVALLVNRYVLPRFQRRTYRRVLASKARDPLSPTTT